MHLCVPDYYTSHHLMAFSIAASCSTSSHFIASRHNRKKTTVWITLERDRCNRVLEVFSIQWLLFNALCWGGLVKVRVKQQRCVVGFHPPPALMRHRGLIRWRIVHTCRQDIRTLLLDYNSSLCSALRLNSFLTASTTGDMHCCFTLFAFIPSLWHNFCIFVHIEQYLQPKIWDLYYTIILYSSIYVYIYFEYANWGSDFNIRYLKAKRHALLLHTFTPSLWHCLHFHSYKTLFATLNIGFILYYHTLLYMYIFALNMQIYFNIRNLIAKALLLHTFCINTLFVAPFLHYYSHITVFATLNMWFL